MVGRVAGDGGSVATTGDAAARAVAHLVDLLGATAVAFVVAGLLSVVTGPVASFESSGTGLSGRVDVHTGRFVLQGMVAAAVSVAWFVAGWTRGATPGMRWCGLRIGGDGSPGTAGATRLGAIGAVVRWLLLVAPLTACALLTTVLPAPGVALWVLAVAWYVVLAATTARHPAKRGLHDRVSGSRVVRSATLLSS
jgi:uncharacterized RDD family membrane protein YckC